MNLRAGRALLLALVACGCSSQQDNPFTTLPETQPPPADADLLVVSSGPDSAPSNVHDVYAVDVETGTTTRPTGCFAARPLCDVVDVAPGPDRDRVVVRGRVDTNDDGRTTDTDEIQIFSIDLTRAIEGRVLADIPGASGIQWANLEAPLIFNAPGEGGLEDLYDALVDGTDPQNLSSTADQAEYHPRVESSLLLFERGAPNERLAIWGANSSAEGPITEGDPTLDPVPLPGTPYLVGSDADPDLSSTLNSFVFRRLVGIGDGRGNWNIMTLGLGTDGAPLAPLAVEPAFRSAADWGRNGIAFVEEPAGASTGSLVVIDPGTGSRRAVLTARAGSLLSPRWLQ